MAERFVCVGHLVSVFALLDGGTTGLHRVQQFASKTLFPVPIVSILGFALMARVGEGLWLLAMVIGFEYLGVGLGTAAFIAFIFRVTNPAFAATQLALFTAITAVPRTLASSVTGVIVENLGWENFFYLCTLLAIPGMLLLLKVAPWHEENSKTVNSESPV